MSEPIIYSRSRTPDYTVSTAPAPTITLYQMAEMILNRTRQAFEERGVLLPNRQIIYMSPLPVDCEQLAVLISGWLPMPGWEGAIRCQNIRWAGQFSVVVSRATTAMPKGNKAPSPEMMNKAAQIGSEDAEAILAMVGGLGELGQDFALEIGAPQGGFQTVLADIQVPAFGGLE